MPGRARARPGLPKLAQACPGMPAPGIETLPPGMRANLDVPAPGTGRLAPGAGLGRTETPLRRPF